MTDNGTTRWNPPRWWREAPDGTLACPHRDLTVCNPCAANNPEATEVHGAHFWVATPEARAEIAALSS